MKDSAKPNVPNSLLPKYLEVTAITDEVCARLLGDEYLVLCREMTASLCRKRPSPITKGNVRIWAGAIAYAIGQINFLFDPTQDPYVTQDDFCEAFGVKRRTVHEKANEIMKLLNTQQFDPKWWRPSQLAENDFVWFLETDTGLLIDAREMNREFQEAAFAAGLIPFVP